MPLRDGGEAVPLRQFQQTADYRPRIDFRKGRAAAGQGAAQHIDGGVGQDHAQAARLGKVRDKERSTAGAGERLADRLKPAAVAIRLDHSGAIHRQRLLAEQIPIRLQRRKVDSEHAARFVLRRPGVDWLWARGGVGYGILTRRHDRSRVEGGASWLGCGQPTRARDQQKWVPVLRKQSSLRRLRILICDSRANYRLRMIFSENRFPLFGIMRWLERD